MEGLVIIIIIAVVINNLRKQAGRAKSNGTPYSPAQDASRRAQAGQGKPAAQPAEAAQTAEAGQPAEAASPAEPAPPAPPRRRPFEPRPLTPVHTPGRARPARPSARGAQGAPADKPAPAAQSGAQGEQMMMPVQPLEHVREPAGPAQPELCYDGYGSLEHTRHEGDEFHAPGTHSLSGRRPSESGAQNAPEPDDERAPELMGVELHAEQMRRAVVFSEILNKRGGRHGWVRI